MMGLAYFSAMDDWLHLIFGLDMVTSSCLSIERVLLNYQAEGGQGAKNI